MRPARPVGAGKSGLQGRRGIGEIPGTTGKFPQKIEAEAGKRPQPDRKSLAVEMLSILGLISLNRELRRCETGKTARNREITGNYTIRHFRGELGTKSRSQAKIHPELDAEMAAWGSRR